MPHSLRVKFAFAAMMLIVSGMFQGAYGQNSAAANNLPNPYRAVEGWAKLPAGVQWGQVISVEPDAHGNIWVFHRSDPAILQFDPSGKLLKSFGAGMFV